MGRTLPQAPGTRYSAPAPLRGRKGGAPLRRRLPDVKADSGFRGSPSLSNGPPKGTNTALHPSKRPYRARARLHARLTGGLVAVLAVRQEGGIHARSGPPGTRCDHGAHMPARVLG